MNHELFNEEFKQNLEDQMASWVDEDAAYNEDMVEQLDFPGSSIHDGSSPTTRGFPEEFCNVNELLTQLETKKSLADISMKQ